MKIRIEAEPGELAEKAHRLLKALAEDLAPASGSAQTVLEALDHLEQEQRQRAPMRSPVLQSLREGMAAIVREELAALEHEILTDAEGIQKGFLEDQRNKLRRLIRRTWASILARTLGRESLSAEDLEAVEASPSMLALTNAYAVGRGGPVLSPVEQEALREATRNAGELIQGLTDRTAETYERALQSVRVDTGIAIAAREGPRTLAGALRQASGDLERDWDRVAVTELQGAHNRGRASLIRSRDPGGDPEVFKQPAPDACSWCLRLHLGPDGHPRIFRLSSLPADNRGRRKPEWTACVGPTHPNCHPEGTLLDTPRGKVPIESLLPGDFVVSHEGNIRRVTHAWRTRFVGELIRFTTADGRTVTATPNHPLLCNGAWKSAESLQLGDNLVGIDVDTKTAATLHAHADESPPVPLENRRLVRILSLFSRRGVPVPAIDLDGQLFVWEGDVDVDSFEGKGRDADLAAQTKSLMENAFVGRLEASDSSLRCGGLLFRRSGPTPNGLVCGARVLLPLLGSAARQSQPICLEPATLLNPSSLEAGHDGATADAEADSYLLHGEQIFEMESRTIGGGGVQLSHYHTAIVQIEKIPFEGQVFNLTVEVDHTYVADSIASHNCQCELFHVPAGWGFDEAGDLVPEGRGGTRAADLEKALAHEQALEKAALVGGEIDFAGFPVKIEAQAGDVKFWRNPDGSQGRRVRRFPYGEIPSTVGLDGDPVDVFLGHHEHAPFVYVVDQLRQDGSLDEQKVFLGFMGPSDVEAAYLSEYPPSFLGQISQLTPEAFRQALFSPDRIIKAGNRLDDAGASTHGYGLAGVVEPQAHPQRPGQMAVAVELDDSRRRELRKRSLVPVVPLVLVDHDPEPALLHEIHTEPLVPEEERTEEIERQSARLEAWEKARRRTLPHLPSGDAVVPTVPVDLTSR